jgi:hypothetical protein
MGVHDVTCQREHRHVGGRHELRFRVVEGVVTDIHRREVEGEGNQ